jgi:hypothetical protein
MNTRVLTCATVGCGRCIEVDARDRNAPCFNCSPYGKQTNDPRVQLYGVKCTEEWTTQDGRVHQCRLTAEHHDPRSVHLCCCGAEMVDATKPFTKGDAGKPMMGCLPPHALLATARVLTYGGQVRAEQLVPGGGVEPLLRCHAAAPDCVVEWRGQGPGHRREPPCPRGVLRDVPAGVGSAGQEQG